MVHACCFHTGSASFCVACRNDSTIFSPCQPFLRKKLLRTCGRRARPPALCAVWAWSPLAYVLLRTCGPKGPPALCALFSRSPLACGRVPYPPYARCGMGRLCGERRRRERFERPSGARNAACSTRHRPPPGLPPAPAVGWFGGVRRPLQVYSESSDMRGGFGSLAQARLPYAGRRPASRRQSRRRSRRPAHPPAEKIGASRAFPPRS